MRPRLDSQHHVGLYLRWYNSILELASIGFEIGIAALHAAFSAEQNPGIGSVTLNVSAREVLDNNPYFYEMIYDIIIESLLDPKPLF